MELAGWSTKRFLIDGFPRNEDNEEGWQSIMGDSVNMEFVLFLECSEELMIERILKRAEDAGESARNDDNEEVLRRRFALYSFD